MPVMYKLLAPVAQDRHVLPLVLVSVMLMLAGSVIP